MQDFHTTELRALYKPPVSSHKGQNGKLLLIGGSHLFHAASLWALNVASRIVDMVFYSSVPENNQIVMEAKKQFHDGIVIPRSEIESYINEADCILIGPGMLRATHGISNFQFPISNLEEVNKITDEGIQTYALTRYLLEKYPHKRWVIDAGALQMLEPDWLKPLQGVIITPHQGEFEGLVSRITNQESRIRNEKSLEKKVAMFAEEFGCIVLLKGEKDIICSPSECVQVSGGNAGMTKGGTGDVLAGLVAALACKNDPFLAASAGSYINKKAGERLYERVGPYFNASDLTNEIPVVMKGELS